jgi:hypothetical protein
MNGTPHSRRFHAAAVSIATADAVPVFGGQFAYQVESQPIAPGVR